jgi:hypothetical protein
MLEGKVEAKTAGNAAGGYRAIWASYQPAYFLNPASLVAYS